MLIAPSFLGTDNTYLLSALAQAPRRLRGTVAVEPGVDRATLRRLDRLGVVGVRLNLYRRSDVPDLASATYRPLLRQVADLGWHVEIYAEGPKLPPLLTALARAGAKAVVDHFGSPDPREGVRCPGFVALLRALVEGRAWVKLSAPYRLGGADPSAYARRLLEAGPERLLWGSDWPWTQHDAGLTYGATHDWLEAWVPDVTARRRIEWDTPARLFRFDD